MSQMQNKRIRGLSFFLIVVVLFLSASFSSLSISSVSSIPSISSISSFKASAASLTESNREAYGNLKLALGGMPFGVQFMTEGVLIVGMSDVQTKTGTKNPAKEAGLRIGDRILKVGNQTLLSAAELPELVAKNRGKVLKITYLRAGKEQTA